MVKDQANSSDLADRGAKSSRAMRLARWVGCLLALPIASVLLTHSPTLLRLYALRFPVWLAHGRVAPKTAQAAQIVAGARMQIGTLYEADYVPISYPLGDVPKDRGACSDVVIRSLRNDGIDLQQLIHEDMLRAPNAYANGKSPAAPDSNIDHRRCTTQMHYFDRHGQKLTNEVSSATLAEWQPGDIVYWRPVRDSLHVGVVSDRVDWHSVPLVIHNGSVCLEQDSLTDWPIVGHYRFANAPTDLLTSLKRIRTEKSGAARLSQ